MRLPRFLRLPARHVGTLVCVPALVLLWQPSLLLGAVGLELFAAAFWLWARSGSDPEREIPRWAWLRRPALAMWLAVGLTAAIPSLTASVHTHLSLPFWQRLAAGAIVWAGLDLIAALPLSRPFSDLPGPLRVLRPWLPVLIPAAGFALLWRHQESWLEAPTVRSATVALLLVAVPLAALRAFGRRRWTAALRWLAVTDCAFGVLLVALQIVPAGVSLMLWTAACGGHALLLAGELGGSMPRRGVVLSSVWRTATWTACLSLSWPVLATLAPGERDALHTLGFATAALAVALVTWTTVGRMLPAPERRAVMRPDPPLSMSHLAAAVTFVTGPIALLFAIVSGFVPTPTAAALAAVPAILGGIAGLTAIVQRRRRPAPDGTEAAPSPRRSPLSRAARVLFTGVVLTERAVVVALLAIGRLLLVPVRDLHTGDAQDYLLFLAALSVLVLVLPLLR